MWADFEPNDPSPTMDQGVNGGFSYLNIRSTHYFGPRFASRLRCQKCGRARKRPAATLLQLAPRSRNGPPAE